MPKIVLASDYRGVDLRDQIASHAREHSWDFMDIGIPRESTLDYVDISRKLAESILAPDTVGVIICDSGEGVAMATNRYSHVRAAVCRTPTDAVSVRSRLNANTICLSSRHADVKLSLEIIDAFLTTPFSEAEHGPCAAKLDTRPTDHSHTGVNLIVRAVIEHNGHVLFCRTTKENKAFDTSLLFLPGGHVDHNEAAQSALAREIREEMNLEIDSADLISALECSWDRNGSIYHELNLVYKTRIGGLSLDTPPPSTEKLQEFVWKPIPALSDLNILPRQLVPMLEDSFRSTDSANAPYYSEMLPTTRSPG